LGGARGIGEKSLGVMFMGQAREQRASQENLGTLDALLGSFELAGTREIRHSETQIDSEQKPRVDSGGLRVGFLRCLGCIGNLS